jgi:Ca-activated chloride channel family protein
METTMTLLAPYWLWLLLPVAALVLLRRRDAQASWDHRHLWLLLSILLVIIALARPAIEKEPIEVDQSGSDVIIAVDLSFSMQAADLPPNRLETAKTLLHELVSINTKDRFGVIGFTTNAIILSPMTHDGELLLHLFDALDEQMIITKGTRMMGTLELARRMSSAERPKLFLLTDGGDALNYTDEAVYAKDNGLVVNVVLLGTSAGSTLLNSDGTLMKDEKGNIVVSSLNRAVEQLADVTGGMVLDTPDAGALMDVIASQKEDDYTSKTKVMEYDELFYGVIALAVVAFMLSVTTLGRFFRPAAIAFWIVLGLNAHAGVLDGYYDHAAREAYREEAYEKAAEYYAKIGDSRAVYNRANSLYMAGEWGKSLSLYKQIRSADADFKATLFFNMANCYIRLQEFEQARTMLRHSLALKHDQEAIENLYAISRAEEQDRMLSGRQKGKERDTASSAEAAPPSKKDRKEGGGSNMDAAADASSGSSEGGKKVRGEGRIGLSKGNAKLSSRQYEMINKRSVNEAKPW